MKSLVSVVLISFTFLFSNLGKAVEIKCDRRIEMNDPWDLDIFKYEFKVKKKSDSELRVKTFLDGKRLRDFVASEFRNHAGEVVRLMIQQKNESPLSHTRLVFEIDVRECGEQTWGHLFAKRVGRFTNSSQIIDWNVPCICE